jgi:hypothetical protein
MARPADTDYPPFPKRYVDLVQENDVYLALENQERELPLFLDGIHSSKAGYAYAPGKWTIAQALQHVMDSERIFAYRALSFARGERQPLPGFEQDDYAALAPAAGRSLVDITEEMLVLRKSTICLFKSFDPDVLQRSGTANGNSFTVLSLGYMIVGHMQHHMNVISGQYLIG